jgi:hypothetical protein
MALRHYKRRPDQTVYAIKLDLATDGFDYEKWNQRQHCKSGDWLVRNGDDTYTVDAEVFARTYQQVGPIEYRKLGSVWAEQAEAPGSISTKEGRTEYETGDYLVYNDRAQTDGYAVSREKFEEMYEEA